MAFDIRETVTKKIISAMETADANGWKMPWRQYAKGSPVNAKTGNPYNGINILLLQSKRMELQSLSPRFATFKQWKDMGRSVAKGQKGEMCVYYKRTEITETDKNGDEETRSLALLRYFTVFNEAQLQDYDESSIPEAQTEVIESDFVVNHDKTEQFVKNTGANVKHSPLTDAYFNINGDFIAMPSKKVFEGTDYRNATESYYGVLLHELTHWTGTKDRTGRLNEEKSYRTRKGRAFEELVAELGAAFLSLELGVVTNLPTDHAQYVKGWLTELQNDKSYIFVAAARAAEAAEYCRSLQPDYIPPDYKTAAE